MLFSMRPLIPVSQDASERLNMLQELHALICTVLQLYKDDIQARSKPSTAPHFVRGVKVTVVTEPLLARIA
jgi:hypothetical protein